MGGVGHFEGIGERSEWFSSTLLYAYYMVRILHGQYLEKQVWQLAQEKQKSSTEEDATIRQLLSVS